nr:MAG TPA: Phosphoglucomutase/phosphomannomutase [Caudoviricetes sp.]
MKVIRNSDNKLMKGRIVEEVLFESVGVFQVRELKKGSKWTEANINDFRVIKSKTIKCTWVDHKNPTKKTFKAGKRYQIEQGRVLGGVAGYVFDEDGDRFTLYREEVGFSACGTYLFEAKYS